MFYLQTIYVVAEMNGRLLLAQRSHKYIQRNGNVFKHFYILQRNIQLGRCHYPRRTVRASLQTADAIEEIPTDKESPPWDSYVKKDLKNNSLESHISTAFGHIRIDSENSPQYHGQQDRYDIEDAERSGDIPNPLLTDLDSADHIGPFSTSKEVFVPLSRTSGDVKFAHSDYFKEGSEIFIPKTIQFLHLNPEDGKTTASSTAKNSSEIQMLKSSLHEQGKSPDGFLDEHYFGQILHKKDNYLNLDPKLQASTNQPVESDKLNEIDQQYFAKLVTQSFAEKEYVIPESEKSSDSMYQLRPKDITTGKNDKLNVIDEQMFGIDGSSLVNNNSPLLAKKKKCDKESKKKLPEKKPTALDYVNKMRQNFKFDLQANSFVPNYTREQEISRIGESLQSRIIKVAIANKLEEIKEKQIASDDTSQIENLSGKVNPKFLPVDLESLTTVEVENIVKNSVIYDDHDIVAIHKPYGLQMFGESKTNRHSVENLLNCLYDQVHVEKTDDWPGLMPVHRLDKNTTGILLCAKTKEKHNLLTNLFRQRKIQKRYWAILNGTPDVDHGIIDIPIGNIVIKGRHRLTLRPDYSNSKVTNKRKYNGDILPAVTEYSVLKIRGNSSLVEVRPSTGFKHQIRVHMGLGLSTPILGDHKYSRISELDKPQKVHGDILQKLEVRKTLSRDLPLCLHAKQVLIPDIVEGRHVSIDCSLPHFFVKIMKNLNLKPLSHVR